MAPKADIRYYQWPPVASDSANAEVIHLEQPGFHRQWNDPDEKQVALDIKGDHHRAFDGNWLCGSHRRHDDDRGDFNSLRAGSGALFSIDKALTMILNYRSYNQSLSSDQARRLYAHLPRRMCPDIRSRLIPVTTGRDQ